MKTKIFSCYYKYTESLEKDLERFYKYTDIIDFISIKEFVVQDRVIVIITYVGDEIEQEKPKPKEKEVRDNRKPSKHTVDTKRPEAIANNAKPDPVDTFTFNDPNAKFGSEPNQTITITNDSNTSTAVVDLKNTNVQDC